jgi:hypothetical protein
MQESLGRHLIEHLQPEAMNGHKRANSFIVAFSGNWLLSESGR